MLLRGFALPDADGLLAGIGAVAAVAPFRNMVTPGGYRMSVAMTNCGVGWVTDRSGYRYDPRSLKAAIPGRIFRRASSIWPARAAGEAGFPEFRPDSCLINRYEPGARLSLHQDRNERDYAQPIVSVSLGLPAIFLFGGQKRADRPRRYMLRHGDVAVWGGPARLTFHGVAPLAEGEHPTTGAVRFNLTFRRAL